MTKRYNETDINRHVDELSIINNAIEPSVMDDLPTLKLADVSNPCKLHSVYKNWTDKIMDEFNILGAVEENIGLNKSAFIKDPKLANCQIVRRPILFLWQKLMEILRLFSKNFKILAKYRLHVRLEI